MRKFSFAVWLMAAAVPLMAAEPCVTVDKKAVAALFDDWNFALSSLDARQVSQRYWPNAVLLPTLSNTPRTSAAMISDYFEHFLAKRPRGRIDTRTIQTGCNMAVDMGTYTFSLMDDKGTTSEVGARYTFVYQYRDGAWKILHHHSSAMPEGAASEHAEAVASAESTPAAAASEKTARAEPEPAPKKSRWRSKESSKPVAPPSAAVMPTPAPPAASPAVAAPPAPVPATPVAAVATPAPAAAAPVAPAAADGSPEVRTSMFANLASSPPPANFYPPESARHKEHGSVNLKVCTDGAGAISGTPEVMKSSGSPRLDAAAQTWARAARWVPATLNRRRVEGCTQVDVAFDASAALGKSPA